MGERAKIEQRKKMEKKMWLFGQMKILFILEKK